MKSQFRDVFLFLGAMLAIGLIVVDAMAQPPGKGPPPGKGKGPPLVKEDLFLKLLNNPAVQKEIEISESQYKQFQEIAPKLRDRVAEILGDFDEASLSPQDRKALQDKVKQHEAELQGWVRDEIGRILTAKQKQRLQELAMQADGAKALSDTAVIKQLRLSEQQLAEMERIRQEEKLQRDEVKRFFPPGKEGGDLRKEQEDKIRQEAEARVWAVLTKEQQKTWEQMTGKAVDLKGPPKEPKPPKDAPPKDAPPAN